MDKFDFDFEYMILIFLLFTMQKCLTVN